MNFLIPLCQMKIDKHLGDLAASLGDIGCHTEAESVSNIFSILKMADLDCAGWPGTQPLGYCQHITVHGVWIKISREISSTQYYKVISSYNKIQHHAAAIIDRTSDIATLSSQKIWLTNESTKLKKDQRETKGGQTLAGIERKLKRLMESPDFKVPCKGIMDNKEEFLSVVDSINQELPNAVSGQVVNFIREFSDICE